LLNFCGEKQASGLKLRFGLLIFCMQEIENQYIIYSKHKGRIGYVAARARGNISEFVRVAGSTSRYCGVGIEFDTGRRRIELSDINIIGAWRGGSIAFGGRIAFDGCLVFGLYDIGAMCIGGLHIGVESA
jgi:hypothetical protein